MWKPGYKAKFVYGKAKIDDINNQLAHSLMMQAQYEHQANNPDTYVTIHQRCSSQPRLKASSQYTPEQA